MLIKITGIERFFKRTKEERSLVVKNWQHKLFQVIK